MPVREILLLGNPLLHQPCARVNDPASAEIQTIIQDLSITLAEFRGRRGFGRAIAAPQIGALQRLLFVKVQPDGFYGALINPEIVWASAEKITLWDDCFSFPDLLVQVERARKIKVEYQDAAGQPQQMLAADDLAELLQHELDHLDGVLTVQRALTPQSFSLRSEWEKYWKTSPGESSIRPDNFDRGGVHASH
jgi:peptide deformylase